MVLVAGNIEDLETQKKYCGHNLKKTKHREFERWCPDWKKNRDCWTGSTAIKKGRYLYKLRVHARVQGRTYEKYADYLEQAYYYPVVYRTVEGVLGMIFQRAPQVILPEPMEILKTSMDGKNTDIYEWMKSLMRDIILESRRLLMGSILNGVPITTGFCATTVTHWCKDGYAVYEEEGDDSKEAFVPGQKYEAFHLYGTDERGAFYMKSMRYLKNPDKSEDAWVNTVERFYKGQSDKTIIPFLPLADCRVGGDRDKLAPAPASALCDASIKHYNELSRLSYARGITLPIPWVTGASVNGTGENDSDEFTMEPGRGLVFRSEKTRLGMLEHSGAGLGSMENGIKHIEEMMAFLGSRMISQFTDPIKTLGHARLQYASEHSNLGSPVDAVEIGTNEILRKMAEWIGAEWRMEGDDENPAHGVTFNRDFIRLRLEAADIQALQGLYMSNMIPLNVALENLQKGGIISEDSSLADIADALEAMEQKRLESIEKSLKGVSDENTEN